MKNFKRVVTFNKFEKFIGMIEKYLKRAKSKNILQILKVEVNKVPPIIEFIVSNRNSLSTSKNQIQNEQFELLNTPSTDLIIKHKDNYENESDENNSKVGVSRSKNRNFNRVKSINKPKNCSCSEIDRCDCLNNEKPEDNKNIKKLSIKLKIVNDEENSNQIDNLDYNYIFKNVKIKKPNIVLSKIFSPQKSNRTSNINSNFLNNKNQSMISDLYSIKEYSNSPDKMNKSIFSPKSHPVNIFSKNKNSLSKTTQIIRSDDEESFVIKI
jgi:hypothetical protein